jgi:agmatine deiminase
VPDRRTILGAGLGVATSAFLPGCAKGDALAGSNPLADYEMPLESEPHQRTFMQWPVSLEVYDRKSLARVQQAIARIATVIARHEPVVMLGGRGQADGLIKNGVELWDIPTDDLWCRDSGPTFVRNKHGALAVAHIKFNGWGNKQPHANDARIAQRVAQRLGIPMLPTGLVGEQGGLEHDGAGVVLAHASCWVNPNRNQGSARSIGEKLLAAVGARKMIWAPGIAGKDITDYHIDALARFVAPGKVLIQLGDTVDPADPWSVAAQETLDILSAAKDANGRKLDIVRLPEPVNIRNTQPDFVSSYVNYYVCNGAVICAGFGDIQADGKAREILQSLYPGRVIEMINVDPIGESGGGIHCATQQQPRAKPA